ncbi:hypothetical protein [Acidilobus sp.]|uniref:hypothetical protein n=1 Tax=Acidilobus sp. TaxID=1872109 RepID=UPI003D063AE4
MRALAGLHGRPIESVISSLTAAATSINVGDVSLAPYSLQDALERREGLRPLGSSQGLGAALGPDPWNASSGSRRGDDEGVPIRPEGRCSSVEARDPREGLGCPEVIYG